MTTPPLQNPAKRLITTWRNGVRNLRQWVAVEGQTLAADPNTHRADAARSHQATRGGRIAPGLDDQVPDASWPSAAWDTSGAWSQGQQGTIAVPSGQLSAGVPSVNARDQQRLLGHAVYGMQGGSRLGSALPCPADRSVPGRGGPERRRRPRPDGTEPRSVLGPWSTGSPGARAATDGDRRRSDGAGQPFSTSSSSGNAKKRIRLWSRRSGIAAAFRGAAVSGREREHPPSSRTTAGAPLQGSAGSLRGGRGHDVGAVGRVARPHSKQRPEGGSAAG
jgi:hypothetical protein